MSAKRLLQVGSEIQAIVANLFATGQVNDPRLKGLSIHKVKLSPDLGIAKVYYGVPEAMDSADGRKQIAKALEKFQSFVRKKIASDLSLRVVPEVRFYFDDNFEHAQKINKILSEIDK